MDFLVILGFIIAVNWLCLTLVWLISLKIKDVGIVDIYWGCLLYTSPSPRDGLLSRMPSSA